LKDNVREDTLRAITVRLDIGHKACDEMNEEALRHYIVRELTAASLNVYFQSFSVRVLRDVAYDMNLVCAKANFPKLALIDAIIFGKKLLKRETMARKTSLSPREERRQKKQISSSMTAEEIFNNFTVADLKKYCGSQNIKVASKMKKLDIVNAVVDSFSAESDKENSDSSQPTNSTKQRKKTQGKKKTTSSTTKTKPTTKSQKKPLKERTKKTAGRRGTATEKKRKEKKEKVVEEETEVEEVEEVEEGVEATFTDEEEVVVDEDEIDEYVENLELDELHQYSIRVLQQYCLDEELDISHARSKAALIDVILAYNAESEDDEADDDGSR